MLVELLRRLFSRQNIHDLAAFALAKLDAAVCHCKQSVVLADAHVLTRMGTCAALANDDGACGDDGAVKNLDAKSLCV